MCEKSVYSAPVDDPAGGASATQGKSGTGSGDMHVPLVDSGDPSPALPESLQQDLVIANRILARHKVVDAFGHVSIRHPDNPERYVLCRNMAPALVAPEDLIEFDLDSNPVNADGRAVYLERFLHGEIYKARSDVHAIVHSHALAVVPFGVVPSSGLQPLWHMSAFLPRPVPVFDIRDAAGDGTDLLIRNPALGSQLATDLAAHPVILMRGHGATVVADNLRQVVFRAVYTQVNAELQLNAQSLGEIEFLSEAEALAATIAVGGQDKRAWDLWAAEVS